MVIDEDLMVDIPEEDEPDEESYAFSYVLDWNAILVGLKISLN